MKNACPVRLKRRPVAQGAAALASFAVMASALAATDISQTPLVVRNATLAKPNIMLLMDNSGSMGRTHMPDEMENVAGVKSIGYKSAQCNSLYYNPTSEYPLPTKYDGTYFAKPVFSAAPYAGFAAFFTAPDAIDVSLTDLRSEFVPYDWGRNTVLGPPGAPTTGPSAGFAPATPGPAYYYIYTGTQTLRYDAPACRQLDVGASVAATGGGMWTRVDVSTRLVPEQEHFALWYSFYRTRLGLTKSTMSLAFSPLDASKRVGFITVEPKSSPTATAIEAERYLQIGDFTTTATGQKDQWFSKLFSQKPSGASPAREGLARVGRYYGGIGTGSDPRPPGINAGMGGPDPVQYACQQNFTIMTTDGYWNGQTQSPSGGGVDLNGNLVGQRDAEPACTALNPNCVRPIYDGNSAAIRTVTDKENIYNELTCTLNSKFRRTEQLQRKVFNITRDIARNQQRTIQYKQSSSQLVAASVQTIRTVKQTTRTVDQYFIETTVPTQDRYQVLMRKDKIERETEQFQLQTKQQTMQTLENTEVVTQTRRLAEQWQTSSSQFVLLTSQFETTQINFTEEKQQTYKRQWQYIGVNAGGESSGPLPGATCPTGYTCSEYDQFPNQLVDPATCPTPGGLPKSTVTPQNVGNPSLSYVHTDCTPGPQAIADHPVAACSSGVTPNVVSPATDTNGWVRTSCTRVQTSPVYASGYTVASCTASPAMQMAVSPFTVTTCAVTLNTSTPQSSCTPGAPVTDPNSPYNTTQCVQPPGTNYPATNSAQCTPAGSVTDPTTQITTTCTKLADVDVDAPPAGAGCTDSAGTAPPYTKVTCYVKPISNGPKSFASCNALNPGGSPWIKTQCNRVGVAPTPSPVPVEFGTCTGGPNGGAYAYDTTCDLPLGATNETKFVDQATCGVTTHATSSPFIDRECTKPTGANNQPLTAWNPGSGTCPSNPGTSFPFARSTCTTTETMAEVAVERSTCPATSTSTSSPFETTHCRTQFVGGTFTCPGTTPTAPPWIYEECGTATTYADAPYGSCTPGMPAGTGICRQSVVTLPIAEASCVPDLTPSGTNPKVTCTGPTTISSGPADPATCPGTNGPQGGTDHFDISCAAPVPAGLYATPKGVQNCPSPAMDPTTFVVTSCSNPPVTNFALVDSGPCTVATVAGEDSNGWTTTQCVKSDSYIDMTAAACASTAVAQFAAGPEISCVPNGTALAQPANSCADPVTAGETVTSCYSTESTAPWNNYGAACSAGAGSVTGERIDCRRVPVGVDVADNTCAPSGPDPSGIIISCPLFSGPGYIYKYQTRTTVTVTPVSGGSPTGPSVVSTNTTSLADIGPACAPAPTPMPGAGYPAKPTVTIAGCTSWPCTEESPGIGGSHNSLADVAQYYYTTDLRPTLDNVVPKAGVTLEEDIAEHQHMTTFTLALGVSGTLTYNKDYRDTSTPGDFADIRTGAKNWPIWPDPTVDYTNASNYDNPKAIDDFWHTAVNGRGRFFSANSPRAVVQGLGEALAKVDAKTASGAADAFSTLTPDPLDNFVYGSSYQSGTWTGDLKAYTLDTVTGGLSTSEVWSAQSLLNGRTKLACDSRKVFLMRNTTMVDFAWNTDMCPTGSPTGTLVSTSFTVDELAAFSAANIASLSQFTSYLPGDPQLVAAQSDGAVVNFLRGQRGNEGYTSDPTDPLRASKLFRTRDAVLGDLVGSQPVYVRKPFASYADAGYEGFKIANAMRPAMVYVGGNDGMLHAFYGTVDTANSLAGQEAWAVIPSAVLPNLYKLADISYGRGNHQFYVDGSPVAADVCAAPCTSASHWRTILIGGFNAGGKGYYALNVTDPANPVALWEFKQNNAVCPGSSAAAVGNTSDCNLGLSFGKPVVTKLGSEWVVMFTSGYNNVTGAANDGQGFLYVVKALTGEVVHKIGTGAGNGATPSGLAQINNYVDNVLLNNNTLRAYGGDQLGNIWRFEFPPTPSAPRAVLIGTAKAGGTPQPITTRPELAELNGEPFLLVGTGQLLGVPDITNLQVQSVYGIRDSLTTVPSGTPAAVYPTLANELKTMTLTQVGTGATAQRTVACTADCARTNGWKLDLPEAGERVNVDMKLVLGTLIFASNVPEDEPCKLDGHSWFNQLNFRTGEAVSTAPVVASSTREASSYLDTLNVGFNVVQLPLRTGQNNHDYSSTTRQSDATRRRPPTYIAPPDFVGKRISWREIVQ